MHEEVSSLQPIIPPKPFDIFPLTGGRSEGLDAFRFVFKLCKPRHITSQFLVSKNPLFRPFSMANGKKNNKNNNVEIPWPKKRWGKIVGGPLWDRE